MSKITVNNVSFAYDTKFVLERVNMDIASGDFVWLLGQSDCGKSTFLRLMAGLEMPSGGEITVDGEPLREPAGNRCLSAWHFSGAELARSLIFHLHAAPIAPAKRDNGDAATVASIWRSSSICSPFKSASPPVSKIGDCISILAANAITRFIMD